MQILELAIISQIALKRNIIKMDFKKDWKWQKKN